MSNSNYPNLSIIGLLVNDSPGVMMKITGMFARRGFNIASITVGHSERPGLSRITIGAEGDLDTIEQITKQLNKLVDVIKVQHLGLQNTTIRECALIKVIIKGHEQRQEVVSIVDLYRAKAIDVSQKYITIEVVGGPRKVDSFIDVISDIVPIREIVRSGLMAISRGKSAITLN
ncbi:MAG: acetolactate synthase small subunit [Candidatus Lokiarchaeota archaeon]|nr:acetolactate synthase small subunit [Candidatus Lokiarchaeota archaeon]